MLLRDQGHAILLVRDAGVILTMFRLRSGQKVDHLFGVALPGPGCGPVPANFECRRIELITEPQLGSDTLHSIWYEKE